MAEKQRGSGETERRLEGGEKAPQQAATAQTAATEKSGGLHPSIYIG